MGGASMQLAGYGVVRRLNHPPGGRLHYLPLQLHLCVLSLASATSTVCPAPLPPTNSGSCPRISLAMAFHGAGQPTADEATALATVLEYHERTKHSLRRYARGPGGLDWRNQPNPFRRYQGAELVLLEHLPPDPLGMADPPYPDAFQPGKVRTQEVSRRSLSQLLYDSLALSAWKRAGSSTWSLRVNPSSGNLHPTEGYIVSGPVSGVCDEPFVGHYAPKEHALEIRARLPGEVWAILSRGRAPGTFFVAFSSIFWREAWKYGERAFRYCNHDVGHAVAAVEVAAAGLGWNARLLDTWEAPQLQRLLGLGDEHGPVSDSRGHAPKGRFPELEQEHPDCLLAVSPTTGGGELHDSGSEKAVAAAVAAKMEEVRFQGVRNSLSREHVRWGIIYQAAAASRKVGGKEEPPSRGREAAEGSAPVASPDVSVYEPFTLREVVRKRRSAVDMDGQYGMQRDVFYEMLRKAMPVASGDPDGARNVPFGALPWDPQLHMAIFVHRVVRLPPGLYVLVRNAEHQAALRRAMRPEFEWKTPEDCPKDLPLYSLVLGDCKTLAAQVSCQQEIAGDSCFSLGMIARFEPALRERGPWMYPRLFWESGVLGQILYLEAHAVGISATGIGCYFDDSVHELLGIKDKEFQSLYHFTVGIPVVDTRIMSLPAYPGPSVA